MQYPQRCEATMVAVRILPVYCWPRERDYNALASQPMHHCFLVFVQENKEACGTFFCGVSSPSANIYIMTGPKPSFGSISSAVRRGLCWDFLHVITKEVCSLCNI